MIEKTSNVPNKKRKRIENTDEPEITSPYEQIMDLTIKLTRMFVVNIRNDPIDDVVHRDLYRLMKDFSGGDTNYFINKYYEIYIPDNDILKEKIKSYDKCFETIYENGRKIGYENWDDLNQTTDFLSYDDSSEDNEVIVEKDDVRSKEY